jgi:hypothetical protein
MAKITPSALISAITGRMDGNVFQMWRGQIIIKGYTTPRLTKSEKQQFIKGLISNLAGKYDTLSDGNKTAWEDYAALLPDEMSGFNAYVRNNTRLLYTQHGDLIEITTPPSPPNPPDAPTSFSATYEAGPDRFRLYWLTPDIYNLYVTGSYSPQLAYDNSVWAKWKIAQTVASSANIIYIDASKYTATRTVQFKLRVIDLNGEISAETAVISATKTV